jgi:hypothetical protein
MSTRLLSSWAIVTAPLGFVTGGGEDAVVVAVVVPAVVVVVVVSVVPVPVVPGPVVVGGGVRTWTSP